MPLYFSGKPLYSLDIFARKQFSLIILFNCFYFQFRVVIRQLLLQQKQGTGRVGGQQESMQCPSYSQLITCQYYHVIEMLVVLNLPPTSLTPLCKPLEASIFVMRIYWVFFKLKFYRSFMVIFFIFLFIPVFMYNFIYIALCK